MLFSIFDRYPTATIDNAKHRPYINKLKIGKYPASPQSSWDIINQFQDHDIRNRFGKYYKSTQMGNEFSFTMFYSQKMLNRMKYFINDKREILMDATFKVVPKGIYKQLLILYVAYKDNVCCKTHSEIFEFTI